MIPSLIRVRRPTATRWFSTAFCAIVCLAAGCATGPGRQSGIDALHVFSAPVAIDLDGLPGPDGFGLTLYASKAARTKGVPITRGRLEILMFDGVLPADAPTDAQPRRTWTFTTADLKKHAFRSSLGTGYRFTPRWADTPPLGNNITILTRLVSSPQTSVQSAPTTIAVTTK